MSVQAIVTILVLFQGSDAGLVFRQIASLISFLHEQMKPLPCQQDHFVTGTHLLNDKGLPRDQDPSACQETHSST